MANDEPPDEQLELDSPTGGESFRSALSIRRELVVLGAVDLGLFAFILLVFRGERWLLETLGLQASTPARVTGLLLKGSIMLSLGAVVAVDQVRGWRRVFHLVGTNWLRSLGEDR